MLTDEAREQRNAYYREWYAKNKEKQAEYNARYWQRKALEAQKAKEEENEKKEA